MTERYSARKGADVVSASFPYPHAVSCVWPPDGRRAALVLAVSLRGWDPWNARRVGPYPRYCNTSGSESNYYESVRGREVSGSTRMGVGYQDHFVTRGERYRAPEKPASGIEWRMRMYQYPDGSCEGTLTPRVVDRPPMAGLTDAGADVIDGDGSGESGLDAWMRHERCIESAVSRARQGIKRFVRYHDLRRLLTWTNGADGDGWESRQEALDDVSRWLKVSGKLLGNTPVVIVAERGGDGERWHVHGAIRKGYWLPYSEIIASWTAFMVRRGHAVSSDPAVSCHRWHAGDDSPRRVGKHGFKSARVCAIYMAKYVGKDIDGNADYVKNQRRYRVSGGIRPEPLRVVSKSLSMLCALASVRRTQLHAVKQRVGIGLFQTMEVFRCWKFDRDPVTAGWVVECERPQWRMRRLEGSELRWIMWRVVWRSLHRAVVV